MKKIILAVAVLIGLGLSSCQKEEMAKPEVSSESDSGPKKDVTGWD